ncbi:hypothetical protein GUJ93_ZPchr0006g43384 [Zizania palustris]|uniref:Uncharacterized protein n=1 Tax=Zizania palustris TaxID=103762 RepID=A0A8J5VSR5_ZIZPA|nr:hypothetical protein GUJ93_ZPchr0006g43384 [Zizania palustris]
MGIRLVEKKEKNDASNDPMPQVPVREIRGATRARQPAAMPMRWLELGRGPRAHRAALDGLLRLLGWCSSGMPVLKKKLSEAGSS